MKDRDFANLLSTATSVGTLLQQKNLQYGDSFSKTPEILKILFPAGVQPPQYQNLLTIVRMLDKINRISAQGQKGIHIHDCEDAWLDLAGYAILAKVTADGAKIDAKQKIAKACTEAASRFYAETQAEITIEDKIQSIAPEHKKNMFDLEVENK